MKNFVYFVMLFALCANSFADELTDEQKVKIEKSIKAKLIDPDSAKFKWMPIKAAVGSNPEAYCGLVNSKNRMGGYTGDAPFHVIVDELEAKDGNKVFVSFPISIGTANPNSTETIVAVEACQKAGFINFYLAK